MVKQKRRVPHRDRQVAPDRASRQPEEREEDESRAKFARSLARSVFGRHHWDETAERRFREAMAWKNPVYRQKLRNSKK